MDTYTAGTGATATVTVYELTDEAIIVRGTNRSRQMKLRFVSVTLLLVASCARPPAPRSVDRDVRTANDAYVRAFASWQDQVCTCDRDPQRCRSEFERAAPRTWSRCHAEAAAGHEDALAAQYDCQAAVFADPGTCPTTACIEGCPLFSATCRKKLACRPAIEGVRACVDARIPDVVAAALAACDGADEA